MFKLAYSDGSYLSGIVIESEEGNDYLVVYTTDVISEAATFDTIGECEQVQGLVYRYTDEKLHIVLAEMVL